jgi:hypothetical protein
MALADRALGFAAPALLLLSIVLGGASHRAAGVPANALLQGLAVILIVFVVATRRAPLTADGVRPLLLIGGLWLLVGLAFLVPLPYDMWSSLPGRDAVVQGLAASGCRKAAPQFPWRHTSPSTR